MAPAPAPNMHMHMPIFYETEIKRLISQEDWAEYKRCIEGVLRSGPKRPGVPEGRESIGLSLKNLVERIPKIARLYNEYVEDYNEKQKSTIHHLPVFPELDGGNAGQNVSAAGGIGSSFPMNVSGKEEDEVGTEPDNDGETKPGDDGEAPEAAVDAYNDENYAFETPKSTQYGAFWGTEPVEAPPRNAYLHWLEYRGDPFPTVRPMVSEATLIARAVGRGSGWVHDEIMKGWGREQHSEHGQWHRENRVKVLGEEPRCTEQMRREWGEWVQNGGKRF